MPELPEVETIVRQLAPHLPGRGIRRVLVAHRDLLREDSERFSDALRNEAFLSVGRRGKNLVFHLSQPQVLVINLGMTGQLLFDASDEGSEIPPYRGVSFLLQPTGTLHYADARRFGRLTRMSPEGWEMEAARLGPEPLDPEFSGEGFFAMVSRSRSPIRSWLLDQTRIAGIGNIYANEALFRAKVHPLRRCGTLDTEEAARLLASVREVLCDAISARGTTLRDYRSADGERGDFGPRLRIYGREGDPCSVCGETVARIVFGNRSAFFCPQCQQEDSTSAA